MAIKHLLVSHDSEYEIHQIFKRANLTKICSKHIYLA